MSSPHSLSDALKALDEARKQMSIASDIIQEQNQQTQKIVKVTAKNFMQICTNLDSIDFTGTTEELVEMTSGHCNMEIPAPYVNPRMIFDGRVIKGMGKYWLQLKQKGGSHMNDKPCPGCAYMARVQNDGTITFCKEIMHLKNPASGYCNNRADPIPPDAPRVKLNTDHLIEFKCTNMPNSVKLAAYIDNKLARTYEDKGDWTCTDSAFKTDCDARQNGNTGPRKRNELLQKAQEKSILRIDDGSILQWKEIQVIEQ